VNDIFHFTEAAAELSTIDVSSMVLSSKSQTWKLYSYSQRQIFDDLLFRPGVYSAPAISIGHFSGGLGWSTTIDNELDLLIIPKNGGKVVVTADIKSLNSDWVTVSSFTNSWVDYGSGFASAAYRKGVEGLVELMGTISTGTAGQSAFTLPYAPAGTLVFSVDNNGSHATVTIDTSGHVIPSANTRISLNGIRFEAS
jgi:hypothetical protein